MRNVDSGTTVPLAGEARRSFAHMQRARVSAGAFSWPLHRPPYERGMASCLVDSAPSLTALPASWTPNIRYTHRLMGMTLKPHFLTDTVMHHLYITHLSP